MVRVKTMVCVEVIRAMQNEVNQEESKQDEVDGMKQEADSTGEVITHEKHEKRKRKNSQVSTLKWRIITDWPKLNTTLHLDSIEQRYF